MMLLSGFVDRLFSLHRQTACSSSIEAISSETSLCFCSVSENVNMNSLHDSAKCTALPPSAVIMHCVSGKLQSSINEKSSSKWF